MKLRAGTKIACPNWHECGEVIRDVEDGEPITGEQHLCIDAGLINDGRQGHACPVCQQAITHVRDGHYQVRIKGRGWVS